MQQPTNISYGNVCNSQRFIFHQVDKMVLEIYTHSRGLDKEKRYAGRECNSFLCNISSSSGIGHLRLEEKTDTLHSVLEFINIFY